MIVGIDASRAATPQRTGTEAYARRLITALIEHTRNSGHQLRLYFNERPTPGLFPVADHVRLLVIPFPRLWTHLRLAWELARRSPDVFFTPAHVIPLSFRGPSVATVHDLGYEFFPQAHTGSQLRYLRWSTRHNARQGRFVIADSEATRDDLIKLYAVPADKIRVVYPALPSPLSPVTDPAILKAAAHKYGLTAPYLLYLGTLQPRKNLVRLVEAYASLWEMQPEPPPQLVLAGRAGWETDGITSAIESLPAGVREQVVLPGFVDDTDKAALISGATALLFPSLYEGFGFPVLEGFACDTPVLASRNSSLPEVGGQAALLVEAEDSDDIADGMKRLLTDAALREWLVLRGKEQLQRFSWKQAAAQVWDCLEAAARTVKK
jgi:glycosyltransferase involved in cell wall biosynthesis